MPRVFVSHARADDAEIDTLSRWLTDKGYDDHVVDHRNIDGGGSWDAALRREASRAEMLLLYVTPAWLASEDCFAEYRASFYGDKTVLPLLTDGLRAQDLEGPARKRFDTLCASVQGIPVSALPPEGFTEEQIETAISRVARAARIARNQRILTYVGIAGIVLLSTVLVLAVTNAAYVGNVLAKWQVDRSFAASSQTDQPFRDCGAIDHCPEMVPLPAARYAVGHADNRNAQDDPELVSQAPITPVDIPGFAVSKFEITKAQWRACMLSTKYLDDETARCKELVYSEATKDEPVESISWHDAQAYISWLNAQLGQGESEPYRLLSEAEWEYAARGGVQPRTTFSWEGGRLEGCDHANVLNHKMPAELDVRRTGYDCTNATIKNHVLLSPVGSFKPNAFGLFDTAGNVSEWVADCWHESHEGRPVEIGAGAWVTEAPQSCNRVLKGGSWIGHIDLLRPAARVGLAPEVRGFNIGLRVARDILN